MKKKLRLYAIIAILLAGAVQLGTEKLAEINLLTSFVLEDAKGPVIETEVESIRLNIGDSHEIAVATCDDNYDFFCDVTVTDNIDLTTPGTYEVTYTAVDKSGNVTTKSYTVTVGTPDTLIDASIYIPAGYYDSINSLTGDPLKAALNAIVSDHIEFDYTHATKVDVWDILRDADEDPENPDNVIMFYSNFTWPKECQDTNTDLLPDYCYDMIDGEEKQVEWNREHIWSKSRGDFGTTKGAGTDAHHLVAAERRMNSLKNNRHFEDCHDGDDTNIVDAGFGNFTCNDWEFEPRDDIKGDVARMILYMAIRYEGFDGEVDLEVLNDPNSDKNLKLAEYGDLDDLLRWHLEDPVSNKEILRNEVIYGYQGNRNPFIDMPELVDLIWGTS